MRPWGIVVALAGCYQPSAAPGAPCGPNGECPSGLSCVDHVCGGAPAVDASVGDDATDAPGACDTVTCTNDAQPVCDPDTGECRGCYADAECATGICNESNGTCLDENATLYVAKSGSDATQCTRTAPCLTISRAVSLWSPTRNLIAVGAGTYDEGVKVDKAGDLLISGPSFDRSAVTVTRNPGGLEEPLRVKQAHVYLESMTFLGGDNTVRIEQNGFLTVVRADFGNASNNGIDINGSGLYCYGCVIENHGKAGVHASSNSSIELDTNYIAGNTQAGIDLNSSAFDVINSAITVNHGGGVVISLPTTTKRFEFNTVALNDGGGMNLGLRSDTMFVASNNIFASNGMMPQVAPTVSVTYSLFSDTAPPGTGNIAGNPKFVNQSTGDLHIQGNSPARDAADPAATLDYDYDADPRPNGAQRDIGADEI